MSYALHLLWQPGMCLSERQETKGFMVNSPHCKFAPNHLCEQSNRVIAVGRIRHLPTKEHHYVWDEQMKNFTFLKNIQTLSLTFFVYIPLAPKNETSFHVTMATQFATNFVSRGNARMTSLAALEMIACSVVTRYQTLPPLFVNTSAQYGAATYARLLSGKDCGSWDSNEEPNEMSPFSCT